MKNIFLILITFFCTNIAFSQNNNLFVFKTYADYQNNNFVDNGKVTGYGMNLGSNYIIVDDNGKEKKVKINKFWGFKIGDYIYRFSKNENKPVSILNPDFGIFLYIDADFTLRKAVWGIDNFNSSEHNNDGYFYSDNLESEIIEISKIVKYKNPSAELIPFIECIKEANERYGLQAKFNSYGKCIFPKKE